MDGSSVRRPFWHRFHSKIGPEGIKMTSEEPRDSGGRLRSVSGASREGLGSSGAAFGRAQWQKVLIGLNRTARRAGLLEVFDFDI